jgi:hypothetical protein
MSASYNMRNPAKPDYLDSLEVQVRRRSLLERIHGALWLLLSNWRS